MNGLVQMRWDVAWFGMRLAHAARRERWLLRWLLHWLLDWLLGLLFGWLLLLSLLLRFQQWIREARARHMCFFCAINDDKMLVAIWFGMGNDRIAKG